MPHVVGVFVQCVVVPRGGVRALRGGSGSVWAWRRGTTPKRRFDRSDVAFDTRREYPGSPSPNARPALS